MRFASPWGDILLARSALGLTGLWLEGQKDHPGLLEHVPEKPEDPILADCVKQLEQYAQNRCHNFDVPLDLHGTDFQQEVWRALLTIPSGELATYGQLARALNRPNASRAVGMAVGLNPISIIVPCHRVVGAHGDLTGYSGGMERKIALLGLEGVDIKGGKAHASSGTAPLI